MSIYLVPLDAVAEFEGRLRLEPTLNNQQRGIRFAADFEVHRWNLESLRGLKRELVGASEPELSVA
jgi:hypothetical protein